MQTTPIIMERYYYRPLKSSGGRVWKCAGLVPSDPEEEAFFSRWFACDHEDLCFLPGAVIIEGYKGDRVTFHRVKVVKTDVKGYIEPGTMASGINSCEIREVR